MSANDNLQAAQREENRWVIFGKQEKFENAAELYEKAGNTFKSEGKHEEALHAFQKAVECLNKTGDERQSTTVQAKVAECHMKQGNIDEALSTYEGSVIPNMKSDGKVSNVGKIYEKVAEAFHKEGQTDKAIETLHKAAEVYENEEGSSGQRRAKSRLAELIAQKAAQDGNRDGFVEATHAFKDCGDICLEENLLRFNAKKYFFSAILCALASGDAVEAKRLIESSNDGDPGFEESREGKLCQTLLDAVESRDVQSFVDAIQEHDRIAKFTDLETKILLFVKKDMGVEDEGADLQNEL